MICLHTTWQAKTLLLYRNGNQAIQVLRLRGPALFSVLCHFNVQLKERKAKSGEEEKHCERRKLGLVVHGRWWLCFWAHFYLPCVFFFFALIVCVFFEPAEAQK